MSKQQEELKWNDLKNVSGGGYRGTRYRCKCRDCKKYWETNSVKYTKKCSKCGSTNIKVDLDG